MGSSNLMFWSVRLQPRNSMMPTSTMVFISLAIVNSELAELQTSVAEFDFLGYGRCAAPMVRHTAYSLNDFGSVDLLDFEHWYLDEPASVYGPYSNCSLPEGQELCAKTPACIGFDYSCCPNDGQKCIASGRVLFNLGTRPDGDAPFPFSTKAYYGGPTSGPHFQGTGGIANLMDVGIAPDFQGTGVGGGGCYQKRMDQIIV